MKAITIWQPWASLLARGAKQYETRSWATSYRGPIAIHAAKRPFNTGCYLDRELHPLAYALGLPDIYSFDTLPYGAVIATAELIGCHKMTEERGQTHIYIGGKEPLGSNAPDFYHPSGQELLFGNWAPGRYAWEFTNMVMLSEPVLAKGKQGLWNWEG